MPLKYFTLNTGVGSTVDLIGHGSRPQGNNSRLKPQGFVFEGTED